MKRFHYEQEDVCVAIADLPFHTKEYTPEQMIKFTVLFKKELERLQISWRFIEYKREKDALFAYANGDWKCVKN